MRSERVCKTHASQSAVCCATSGSHRRAFASAACWQRDRAESERRRGKRGWTAIEKCTSLRVGSHHSPPLETVSDDVAQTQGTRRRWQARWQEKQPADLARRCGATRRHRLRRLHLLRQVSGPDARGQTDTREHGAPPKAAQECSFTGRATRPESKCSARSRRHGQARQPGVDLAAAEYGRVPGLARRANEPLRAMAWVPRAVHRCGRGETRVAGCRLCHRVAAPPIGRARPARRHAQPPRGRRRTGGTRQADRDAAGRAARIRIPAGRSDGVDLGVRPRAQPVASLHPACAPRRPSLPRRPHAQLAAPPTPRPRLAARHTRHRHATDGNVCACTRLADGRMARTHGRLHCQAVGP